MPCGRKSLGGSPNLSLMLVAASAARQSEKLASATGMLSFLRQHVHIVRDRDCKHNCGKWQQFRTTQITDRRSTEHALAPTRHGTANKSSDGADARRVLMTLQALEEPIASASAVRHPYGRNACSCEK